MAQARSILVVILSAVPFGCTLFADLDGFTGGDAPSPDAAVADQTPGAAEGGATDGAPAGDAGPDVSAYKRAVLDDRPVGYWPFDDAAGSNLAAEIAGGKNAEVVGKVTFGGTGVDGTGLERGPGGGFLDVGDHFDLAGKQAYSIELWARPTITEQFNNVLDKRSEDGMTGWIVYFRTDNGGATVGIQLEQPYPTGGRTTFADVPNPSARFHHFVFTYDPASVVTTRARLYVDALRIDGFTDDGEAADNTVSLAIVSSYVGAIDELAIYDHALGADRIKAHFTLGSK